MKLAAALINRADAQKRIIQLQERLQRSTFVQEGDKPIEQPEALLAELGRTLDELERLMRAINRTNSLTQLANGRTVTDLLAERDRLRLEQTALSAVTREASLYAGRYSTSEIKTVRTVDAAALQRRVDDIGRDLRLLDTRIQQLNWEIDLIEA